MRTRARVSERMKNPGTVKIYLLGLGITRSLQSLSIRPLSGRKKKKTRDVVFTNVFGLSSSSTTKMTRNRMRGNWVLATGNRTDVSLSLLFFVSTLFATRFLPSIRILTSKENFISRFKRNIRNLYIHKQAN